MMEKRDNSTQRRAVYISRCSELGHDKIWGIGKECCSEWQCVDEEMRWLPFVIITNDRSAGGSFNGHSFPC